VVMVPARFGMSRKKPLLLTWAWPVSGLGAGRAAAVVLSWATVLGHGPRAGRGHGRGRQAGVRAVVGLT